VRLRVAEVDHHPVAEVLGDVSVEALGSGDADPAILADDLAQLLGVDALRQLGRADEVAEHHGELAALGPGGIGCLGELGRHRGGRLASGVCPGGPGGSRTDP
jgi:hypothetical protein